MLVKVGLGAQILGAGHSGPGTPFLGAGQSTPDSSRGCLCISTQCMGRQRGSRTQAEDESTAKVPLAAISHTVHCCAVSVTSSHACHPGLLPTASPLALCQLANAHSSPLTVFDTYFIELFTLCSQHPPAHKTNHVLEAYAVIRQWLKWAQRL